MCEKVFPADIQSLHSMLEFIQNSLPFQNVPESLHYKMILALEEALVNIIDYAYPNQMGTLSIHCSHAIQKEGFVIKIEDQGVQFNPTSVVVNQIQASENSEDYKIGGMGIYLYKNVMDHVEYKYVNNRNCLILTKYF